jgi:TRAP transporter TAXI family solute receptor
MFLCARGLDRQHATVRIAAGRGLYGKLADALKKRAADHDIDIDVKVLRTGGSAENLWMLTHGDAQLALVQSDVVKRAAYRRPIDFKHLKLAAVLYTEVIHVLVRPHLYVFTTEDLRDKVVSLGPEGSGTEQTARVVLEASGISLKEVETKPLALEQIPRELGAESIDAAFVVSAVKVPSVQEAISNEYARLLPLSIDVVNRLLKDGGYFETSIKKGDYDQAQTVPTVGVYALLLGVDDIDHNAIARIVEILYKERDDLQGDVDAHLDLQVPEAVKRLDIPFYREAEPYLPPPKRLRPEVVVGSSVLVIFIFIFLYLKRNFIRRSLIQESNLGIILLVMAGILLGCAGALLYYEGPVNENFDTFGKAAWSVVAYAAGDRISVPLTRAGHVVSVIVILFAAGTVAWFVSELAGHLVKDDIKMVKELIAGRRVMSEKVEGHIVILNWDDRARSIVKQLTGSDFTDRRRVVVISPTKISFRQHTENRNIIHLEGDPTDKNVLAEAWVQHAHSVTILSAWTPTDETRKLDPDVADSKTILSILAIRALSKSVPITAEIRAPKNGPSAEAASQGGYIETICVEDFGRDILCQCAQTPGLANLYVDLLTFEKGTPEVYKTKIPKDFIGKNFGDLLRHFAEQGQRKKTRIIPIGFQRSASAPRLNPADAKDDELEEGDSMFVISDHEPQV